jgi:hypothetical protein
MKQPFILKNIKKHQKYDIITSFYMPEVTIWREIISIFESSDRFLRSGTGIG